MWFLYNKIQAYPIAKDLPRGLYRQHIKMVSYYLQNWNHISNELNRIKKIIE